MIYICYKILFYKNLYSLFIDGHPAPHLAATDDPLALFSAFLTDERLEDIVGHTNVKLELLRASIGDANCDSNSYRNIGLDEFKAVIGCLIVAGVRGDNHLNTRDMFRDDFGPTFYR